jgi:hypothetical protein
MPSVMSSRLRGAGRMKHVGRTRNKYAFDATSISASGLPEKLDSSSQELVVQLARGPKIAQCSADVPGGKPVDGCIEWAGKKLSFVATLYSSKTGKAFSDKRYRATLLAAKPAAFGTSKRSFREIGHVDFNLADFAGQAEPKRVVLAVPQARARGGRSAAAAPPIELSFTLSASHLGTAEAGDDDDDDMSISSAISGFSGTSSFRSEAPSEANFEQDLDGFSEEASRRALSGSAAALESSAGKRWSGVSGLNANRAAVSAHYTQQAGGMSAAQVIAARQHASAPVGDDSEALPSTASARDMGAAAMSAHSCWGADRHSTSSKGSASREGKSPWDDDELHSPSVGRAATGAGGGSNPFAPAISEDSNPFAPASGDGNSNPFAPADDASNPFGGAGDDSGPLNGKLASNPFEDGPGSEGNGDEGGEGGEGGGAAAESERVVSAAGRAVAREAACGDGRRGGDQRSREAGRARETEAREHIRQLQGLREGMQERLQTLKNAGSFTKTRPAAHPHSHAAAGAVTGSRAKGGDGSSEDALPARAGGGGAGEMAEEGEAGSRGTSPPASYAMDGSPVFPAAAHRPATSDASAPESRTSLGVAAGDGGLGAARPPALSTSPSQAEQLQAQFAWMREQLQTARSEARQARAERDQLAREAEEASRAGAGSGAESGAIGAGANAAGAAGAAAEAASLRRQVAALEEELAESERKERVAIERAEAAREEAKTALADRDAVLQAVDAGDGAKAAQETAMAEIYSLREEAESMQAERDAGAEREREAVTRAKRAEAELEEARRQLDETVEECERRLEETEIKCDRRLQAAGGKGTEEEYEEQYAELALRLVDAKLAAAQYAYERDEARQRHVKARAGGNQVAEQLTTLEVHIARLTLNTHHSALPFSSSLRSELHALIEVFSLHVSVACFTCKPHHSALSKLLS